MTIVDNHFGGEVVTSKGKVFPFDTVECMRSYLNKEGAPGARLYVHNHAQPGDFLDAAQAFYIEGRFAGSPMGAGIVAVPSAVTAEGLARSIGGARLNWDAVMRARGE